MAKNFERGCLAADAPHGQLLSLAQTRKETNSSGGTVFCLLFSAPRLSNQCSIPALFFYQLKRMLRAGQISRVNSINVQTWLLAGTVRTWYILITSRGPRE